MVDTTSRRVCTCSGSLANLIRSPSKRAGLLTDLTEPRISVRGEDKARNRGNDINMSWRDHLTAQESLVYASLQKERDASRERINLLTDRMQRLANTCAHRARRAKDAKGDRT